MIPILLVTHGPFAQGILESSEMLVGKSEGVEFLTLNPKDDVEIFHEKISQKSKEMDEGAGVLVLVDLLGGSPYNAAARCLRDGVECLTGLNMSMLLTALEQREYCDLQELLEECKNAAVSNVVSVRKYLSDLELDDSDDDE